MRCAGVAQESPRIICFPRLGSVCTTPRCQELQYPPSPFASSPPGAPSPESSPQERKTDLLFVLLLQPKCQTLGLTRGVGASDDLLLARPLFYSLPSLCGHWTGYRRQATSSTESHMPFGQLVPNAAQPYLARPRSPRSPDADLPDYDMMYL